MEKSPITGYTRLRAADRLEAVATKCTSVKRKESSGSGSHAKRGSIMRKIRLAGAEKGLSEEKDEAESLVREKHRQELKSNGIKLKVMHTGQRKILVKQTEIEAPELHTFTK